MKLFLSSQDLGNFAEDLRELVGENRKTLVITNAQDYKDPATKAERVAEKLKIIEQAGFQVQELDLREYFTKDPTELEAFVAEYNPGLIHTIGGNVFLLSTAFKISGMDDILRQRLADDITVYSGHSAGAMAAAKDIETYERDDLKIEEVGAYYGVESVVDGLGLIDEYVIPHANRPERKSVTKFYQEQVAKIGAEAIILNDGDVYIVNGNHKTIKRA